MQIKTLLNRVHPVKGFVYGTPREIEDDSAPNGLRIEVELRVRQRVQRHVLRLRKARAGV